MNTIFAMNEKLCCSDRNGVVVMAYDGNDIIDEMKEEVTIRML